MITKIYEFLKDEIMKHLDKLSSEREAKIVVTLLSLGYNPDKIYTVLSEKSPNMPRMSDKERDYKKIFFWIVKNYNEKGENGGADPNERLLEGLLCSLGHARPDHDEYLRRLIAQMYIERKVLEAIKRLEDLDDAVRDELYRTMEETFRLLREDSDQRIKSMKNKGVKRT